MALLMTTVRNVPLAGDVEVTAYIRVESILMTKLAGSAVAVWHKDDGDGAAFDRTEFDFAHSLDGPNPIAQAYLHLKTLPEFVNAVDC